MSITLQLTEEQLEKLVAKHVEEKLAELGVTRLAAAAGAGNDEIVRGAQAIADVLGCPKSRVNNLRRRKGALWPVKTEGRGLWAYRKDLLKFLEEGGACVP